MTIEQSRRRRLEFEMKRQQLRVLKAEEWPEPIDTLLRAERVFQDLGIPEERYPEAFRASRMVLDQLHGFVAAFSPPEA